jgi:hypothetical protein
VHDVLQADWQEVWHSPQPFPAVTFNEGFAIVFMCFIVIIVLSDVLFIPVFGRARPAKRETGLIPIR